MSIQDQNFGIEIEMTGLSRKKAAEVIAIHFNSSLRSDRSYFSVIDDSRREWKLVNDSSIEVESRQNNELSQGVELVSPICQYKDIKTIQKIVQKLKKEGAMVNKSCGIHIHIDASRFDARTLRNLANIMYCKEDILYKALNVSPRREHRYCKKIEESFFQELNRKKPLTLENLSHIWYNGSSARSHTHYDNSRYHALNLHSVFNKGTVEFRLFNGSLNINKIESYIQMCLAISNQALSQNKASRIKTVSTNEKYTFRTWLLRLGMIGDEFKTARRYL